MSKEEILEKIREEKDFKDNYFLETVEYADQFMDAKISENFFPS